MFSNNKNVQVNPQNEKVVQQEKIEQGKFYVKAWVKPQTTGKNNL